MSNEDDKDYRSGRKKMEGRKSVSKYQATGINELKGYHYVYGVPKQTEIYLRTTRKIADYVGTTISKEMWNLVHELEETVFPDPPEPVETEDKPATRVELEKFRMLFKMKHDDEKIYKKEKARVFRIIVGQCNTTMRNKIEGLSEFKELQKDDNVIGLLGEKLKEFAYSTQGGQYEYWTMQAALRNWIGLRQYPTESIEKYGRRFIEQTEVTENVWGPLIPTKNKGKLLSEQEEAGKRFKACVFLAGVDRKRYRSVIE